MHISEVGYSLLPREFELVDFLLSLKSLKASKHGLVFPIFYLMFRLYPPQGDQRKEGYLTKLGGRIKNWKKRWFVLEDGKLYYYKTPVSVNHYSSQPMKSTLGS